MGSEGFVEAEGQALTAFQAENSVISLTGSNPMHDAGMSHIASTGMVDIRHLELSFGKKGHCII